MRRSFLDDPNIVYYFGTYMIVAPILAAVLSSCSQPTPEKRAEELQTYSENLVHESVTFTPRGGVECVVVRGWNDTNPRMMSCYPVPGPVESNP